uniref:Cation efflux protein transmembrane domain-containing protein n=1 Tax=Spongospora subterranea TaxID=70186 RepID=A0A0H5QWF3_9EUKA|eukprot:CRZ06250.1 hypothetical protein [Spongospora subterranea]
MAGSDLLNSTITSHHELEQRLLISEDDLPQGKVLDRQGHGAVYYRSYDGTTIYRTATDLVKCRVQYPKIQSLPAPIAKFYNEQNAQIDDMIRMEQHIHNVTADVRSPGEGTDLDAFHYHNAIPQMSEDGVARPVGSSLTQRFWETQVFYAVVSSIVFNCILAGLNVWLSFRTGSLSIAASTADTALDLLTSTMLFISARRRGQSDPYNYPYGKTRMEPIGILLFAVIMGMASLAIVGESIHRLITGIESKGPHLIVTPGLIFLIVFLVNVVCKLIVIFYCRLVARHAPFGGSTCLTVAKEQNYDLVTYTGAFLAACLASFSAKLWFMDPVIAIALSFYVALNWISDAREHIQQLVGKSAGRAFISQVTYLALRHDARILFIDDVKAVHFGEKIMVEVHIGLPGDMLLQDSHDIGESLQIKLEGLSSVEIAHVHTDYVYCHPFKEHRIMFLHQPTPEV